MMTRKENGRRTDVPETISAFQKQIQRSGNNFSVPETVSTFHKQASAVPETGVGRSRNKRRPFQKQASAIPETNVGLVLLFFLVFEDEEGGGDSSSKRTFSIGTEPQVSRQRRPQEAAGSLWPGHGL